MITIPESGMIFGPFEETCVYHIENSKLHKKIGKHIRTVEFLLYRDHKSIYFVEAKSSSPQPNKNNTVRFHEFIQEISEKFLHSFNLYYSAILKRHEEICDIPESFRKIDNATVSIRFCLVLNSHDAEWLPPISDALNKKLASHITIWGSQLTVINDKIAAKYKFVSQKS